MSDQATALLRRLKVYVLLAGAVLTFAGATAVLAGPARALWSAAVSLGLPDAQAQAAELDKPIVARIEKHEQTEGEFRRQVLERFAQQDATTYALYRAVLTGRKQQKLEALADGGGP